MVSLKHKKVSAKANATDSTLVRPLDWNDEHDLVLSVANRYLGRDQSAVGGPAQELPVVPSGPGDDGTIWTKAAVEAAIAAAVAQLAPPMGTIVGSINGNMPGYLPLNGTSFGNVASGAVHVSVLYENLFKMIWEVIPTYPIDGGRGATAQEDWDALKTITMPNSAGRTLGAAGGGLGGVFFGLVGEAAHVLTEAEMPTHVHQINEQMALNQGGGSTGGGSVMQWVSDGPYNTQAKGGDGAHNNIQPTLVMQIFWIKY